MRSEDRKAIGKFMVRRATTVNGQPAIILAGVFIPSNFDISEISDSDEMWVTEVTFRSGGNRFTDPISPTWGAGSPEDFIAGQNSMPDDWKTVNEL